MSMTQPKGPSQKLEQIKHALISALASKALRGTTPEEMYNTLVNKLIDILEIENEINKTYD